MQNFTLFDILEKSYEQNGPISLIHLFFRQSVLWEDSTAVMHVSCTAALQVRPAVPQHCMHCLYLQFRQYSSIAGGTNEL